MPWQTYSYIIEPKHEGKQIKEYLQNVKQFSYTCIVKLKQYPDGITVNGTHARVTHRLTAGERLAVRFVDETQVLVPSDIDVPIAFENERLIIFNKPANMPVHPAKNHQQSTLANVFARICKERGEELTFRAINRLDRDTTGLVAVAKDRYTAGLLTNAMEKSYIAVTEGVLPWDAGVIDAPIKRLTDGMTIRHVHRDGQAALTRFWVLNRSKTHTMIRVRLETGRTHQIRVHFSHLGFPLAGDDMYGGSRGSYPWQALSCTDMRFFMDGREQYVTIPPGFTLL